MTAPAAHGNAPISAPEAGKESALRRCALPLAVGALVIGAVSTAQLVFDPFTQHVPLCLFHSLTGLQCPGCGATRAVHALLTGNIVLSLRCHALLIPAVLLAVTAWIRWSRDRMRGMTRPAPRRATVLVVLAVVMVYTVARNLPGLEILTPPGA